ncbi:G kinase-anchoring protein 1-like isoform X2 [Anoplophora glabripennis]|uniref:G kinase-anchoring protein 1-like isoform X2 n=1 Tax=Anoplophora glabripennis TaxID=217634 RepID=UPI000875034A|nr:G kinase-anchoring protein 1-like isoform X2 [Anoplophora glabripennis]
MDISVPSRFACLKIEDEEFRPVSNRSTKKKQEKQAKKTIPVNGSSKKVPGQQNQPQSSTNASSKKSRTKGKKEDKQWEEWKRKDDEFVNDNFEQDLQCAILQSKLDFENQKKNASVSVILTTQDNKMKKKKTKTMSLDQFLEDGSHTSAKDNEKDPEVEDGNFFENVMVSAKQELKKEKLEEKRRERASNIEEVISLAQAQEKLEIEKAKNEQLQQELEEAKKEIALVKKRNTTLCSMLSQGEMKDKVGVLLELERLTTVKEELTEEVARLHKLLEQERSSTKANNANVNGLPETHNAKHKDKNKK